MALQMGNWSYNPTSWWFQPIWKKYARQNRSIPKVHMGVSKNSGTPKWMVYTGNPYQNGWFGGKTHYFRKHPYMDEHKKIVETNDLAYL